MAYSWHWPLGSTCKLVFCPNEHNQDVSHGSLGCFSTVHSFPNPFHPVVESGNHPLPPASCSYWKNGKHNRLVPQNLRLNGMHFLIGCWKNSHGENRSVTSLYRDVQFSSVRSLSRARLFATPWIAALQASLSITNFRSSLRLMFIEVVMPSSHLILCRPLLLLPPNPSQHQSLFQWSLAWRILSITLLSNPNKNYTNTQINLLT